MLQVADHHVCDLAAHGLEGLLGGEPDPPLTGGQQLCDVCREGDRPEVAERPGGVCPHPPRGIVEQHRGRGLRPAATCLAERLHSRRAHVCVRVTCKVEEHGVEIRLACVAREQRRTPEAQLGVVLAHERLDQRTQGERESVELARDAGPRVRALLHHLHQQLGRAQVTQAPEDRDRCTSDLCVGVASGHAEQLERTRVPRTRQNLDGCHASPPGRLAGVAFGRADEALSPALDGEPGDRLCEPLRIGAVAATRSTVPRGSRRRVAETTASPPSSSAAASRSRRSSKRSTRRSERRLRS